ncbi:unnamed protein product [Dracunculus medinensis]|uniref:Acyl_transf_3 domain-containing protein n=1 Tax=Dracunculus medinensis TaxID=318479 RepID=A0A0N4UFY7_DRAME|nr:unnamed protein product [Dracunculus medinensis]
MDEELPSVIVAESMVLFRSTNLTCDEFFSDFLPPYKYISSTIVLWISFMLYVSLKKNTNYGIVSIRKSIDGLKNIEKTYITTLDVFRVVAIIWVIINHTGSEGRLDILQGLPSAEIFKSSIHNHPIFGALLGNSGLGVDIFLVLSGFLASISWSYQENKSFLPHYILFIAKRWVRIFPSLIIFIAIASSPFMQRILPRFYNSIVSSCGFTGTISHLIFLANWRSTPICFGYLWYLSLDMQFYIIAPLLFHLAYKSRISAILLSFALIVFSMAFRAFHCVLYNVCDQSDVDIPFISYEATDNSTTGRYTGLWEIYSRPFPKCGPFLIGFLAAQAFRQMHIKLSISKIYTSLTISSFAIFASIYGILPQYWHPKSGSTLYNVLYTAIFQTLFALALATMIFIFSNIHKRKKSNRLWMILARLTFSVYLVHMPIVFIFNYLKILQDATSPYILIAVVPFVALISFIVGFLFHIIFESPLTRLGMVTVQRLSAAL